MDKFDVRREFASIGNEIVLCVDDEKCSDLFVKFQSFHVQCAKRSSLDLRPPLANGPIHRSPIAPPPMTIMLPS
jgi:hypothetical protein